MTGQPQTPMEWPYKEAQMYMTAKCPDFTGYKIKRYIFVFSLGFV